MRQTLRRSCAACAKSKHSCNLGIPRCSRCEKRRIDCVYANEPLTAVPAASERSLTSTRRDQTQDLTSHLNRFGSIDPFDSYPVTRLPREQVQRLIHSFLHKIAFQYYPLDLNAASNPFLVSWWPLALGDPALFHVSLQTACLDEELLAQRGFQSSEILMTDSVALLRRKVDDTTLALQDGTMNSVITLAAIEFGKGNVSTSEMHVHGAKRLVDMRGGINSVRQTSPLTARMISWVSMLVTGQPQFETQDDFGNGPGIPAIPEWQIDVQDWGDSIQLELDEPVRSVFQRLRALFRRAHEHPLPPTRLHDLTCFVTHRLLATSQNLGELSPSTECVRYATVLYMFILQGPTYYSHAVMMSQVVLKLMHHFEKAEFWGRSSLHTWLVSVGLVASSTTGNFAWFLQRAEAMLTLSQVRSWTDVDGQIRETLWLETPRSGHLFRHAWSSVFCGKNRYLSESITGGRSSSVESSMQ